MHYSGEYYSFDFTDFIECLLKYSDELFWNFEDIMKMLDFQFFPKIGPIRTNNKLKKK